MTIATSPKAKYCLMSCYQKYGNNNKFRNGKEHPFWRTGEYISNNQIRRSYQYVVWQKSIYKRDDYTCQICGDRGGKNLRANHIKTFAEYPELRFIISNGITICSDCDYLWVLRRERGWESYFNFNLSQRGLL